jgi:hypothetical protein
MLNSLKLNPLIIQELEKLYDPLKLNLITEQILRPYVNKSQSGQKAFLNTLKKVFVILTF